VFETFFLIILFSIFIGIPIGLTLFNAFMMFTKNGFLKRTVFVTDIVTFSLGVLFTTLLVAVSGFAEWHQQIYNVGGEYYSPISGEALPTFMVICLIAVLAYLFLRFIGKEMSPILASLCYGGVFIGIILTAFLAIQLWAQIDDFSIFLLLLFPINYVFCSVRLIRNTVPAFSQKIAEASYNSKLLLICQKFLKNSAGYMAFSFFMAVPLLIIAIIILLLFGQQPDSVVKMFTETAEWTLSQKIPPPRLDYTGHYLCTVAACGDEKIVKPIRAGKRNNELIVVNRQLLVANAFEDLIAEKTPRVHKIIRKTYDRIGLPISKYITTKRRSNIVYFIMKPLEWLFVLVLYTFDTKPENRINSQYTGK